MVLKKTKNYIILDLVTDLALYSFAGLVFFICAIEEY